MPSWSNSTSLNLNTPYWSVVVVSLRRDTEAFATALLSSSYTYPSTSPVVALIDTTDPGLVVTSPSVVLSWSLWQDARANTTKSSYEYFKNFMFTIYYFLTMKGDFLWSNSSPFFSYLINSRTIDNFLVKQTTFGVFRNIEWPQLKNAVNYFEKNENKCSIALNSASKPQSNGKQ